MSTVTVKIPHALINPLDANYNAQLGSLASYATYSGAIPHTETKDGQDLTVYENIASKRLPMATAQQVVGAGGDALGYPTFYGVVSMDEEVTAGLPNRTTTDDEGTETVKTWAEWIPSHHKAKQGTDGKWYFAMANSQQYYPLSELTPVFAGLLTAEEYKTKFPSDTE